MVPFLLDSLPISTPAVTSIVPLDTLSVVVSTRLSTSATETPEIGRAVSSATLCAPGTVLTGASFTALTVIGIGRASGGWGRVVGVGSGAGRLEVGWQVRWRR